MYSYLRLLISQKKVMSMKKNKMATRTTINSLPQDLIVEIVAEFIAASPTPLSDLKNLRMTCKSFHTASKAKRVGRCVPVRLNGWNVPAVPFAVLGQLAEAGNLHACFILGLWGVYGSTSTESAGMESLNRAIAGGHKGAAYAMGILLFGEPNTRSQGMELLSRAGPDIERCRTEVASLMRSISWRCHAARTKRCSSPRCGRGSEDGWGHQNFCDLRCRFRYECKHGKWARYFCADPKCGRVEGWSGLPTTFCSPSCRWRYEHLQLYKLL